MSIARKVQKKRNKHRGGGNGSIDDENRGSISRSNDNVGMEDDDSDEAEKRHWHDVSRAFCSYEGTIYMLYIQKHILHTCISLHSKFIFTYMHLLTGVIQNFLIKLSCVDKKRLIISQRMLLVDCHQLPLQNLTNSRR